MRTVDDTMKNLDEGKEKHEGSKALDVSAIEDPKLVQSVEERLRNLDSMTGRQKGRNPAVSYDDLDEDDDPTLDDEKDDDVEDDEPAADSDKSKKSDDSTPNDGEDTIPDAYVRAAIHNGWKEEDIDALVKSNKDMALKTFENLYNSTNKASREWAALGRAKIDSQAKGQEQRTQDNRITHEPLDIAAIKKEFEIDPAFEKVLEKVNDRDKKLVDALNSLVVNKDVGDTQRVKQAAKSYDIAAQAAEEQQINTWFAADSLKLYKDFYGELRVGETFESLPPGQQRNRLAVYKTADQMLAGAAMQGFQMTLTEALEKAHLLVTEGLRKQIVRKEIKDTATKRKSNMVLRPSDSKKKNESPAKTRKDLETKVSSKLAKVFG